MGWHSGAYTDTKDLMDTLHSILKNTYGYTQTIAVGNNVGADGKTRRYGSLSKVDRYGVTNHWHLFAATNKETPVPSAQLNGAESGWTVGASRRPYDTLSVTCNDNTNAGQPPWFQTNLPWFTSVADPAYVCAAGVGWGNYEIFVECVGHNGGVNDFVWITLEYAAARYSHIGFGVLDKTAAGTWSGGAWMYGSHNQWNTFGSDGSAVTSVPSSLWNSGSSWSYWDAQFWVKCNEYAGSQRNNWYTSINGSYKSTVTSPSAGETVGVSCLNLDVSTLSGYFVGSRRHPTGGYSMLQSSYSRVTGRTKLFPAHVGIDVVGVNTVQHTRYIGVIPNIHPMSMALFTGGEAFTKGADEYRFKPANFRTVGFEPATWRIAAVGVLPELYLNNTYGLGYAIRKPP